ncbi:biotin--[acetyl-CoA-carboxylase] ligase [Corticibacter populi]|nr:biotin--[acetyl-CoA-carboxylase] ligase [Corticibacter populi]RZS33813.1 BirA family biotin operon repressor/biotin-[acetyl-CoA-carboxylase] ligase [Corticibacter populi]
MTAPKAWQLSELQHAAEVAWPGFALQWLDEVDSSNSELMRRCANGVAAPCLLLAGRQSAGRGRLGKPWHGDPEASLAMSLGVPLAPADWSGLSLAVGVALVQALMRLPHAQPLPPARAQRLGLKWPNDLWLMDARGQGRKMAGILIETAACQQPHDGSVTAAPAARYVVIGIGLNLRQQALPDLSVPMASVAEWTGLPPQPGQLLGQFVPALLQALRRFEHQGFAAFRQAFAACDLLHGRQLQLSDGRQGLGAGVDATGELLLDGGDGAVERVISGEVSVRPLAQAPV